MFEHIKRQEILNVLLEWNRVLKIGGLLRIAVPDFEKIVKVYLKNGKLEELNGLINGGQTDDYDIHYCAYDFNILSIILQTCGFKNIKKYDPYEFLGNKDDYSKCYLPHMDTNGELMSLNIVCTKNKNVTPNNIDVNKQLKQFCKLKPTY